MVDGLEPVVHGMGSFMMLWFVVLPALVAVLLLVLIARMFRSRGSESAATDDVRLLQELHSTMDRLERRVEALETLLADDARRDDNGWRGGGRP
ncbi:phage shock protein B [Desulfovibrio desulfuricans]|nr:phage shock protein B [Desulfovibrio desulfuricans]